MSASTLGMLATPIRRSSLRRYGEKQYRIGDRKPTRSSSGRPFTFVHYPSKQNLGLPGQPEHEPDVSGEADGNLTERTSFAVSELIPARADRHDIDVHEASIGYRRSTYVCHERAEEMWHDAR